MPETSVLLKPVRRRPSSANRKGLAAVEMAIVLPVLLVVVFGTVAASQLMFYRKSMVAAVGEGIRLASQRTATTEDVHSRVNAVLSSRRVTGATITLTPENIELAAPGDVIELELDADFTGMGIGIFGESASVPVKVKSSILRE